jgi:hypothetical protein
METLINHNGQQTPSNMSSAAICRIPWLVCSILSFLVSIAFLQFPTVAQIRPEISAGDPSTHTQSQQALTVQDRKNQWFFAEAVATSLWELAMYAERLTLNGLSDRVETLQQIYTALMNIEGEIALKRKNLANQHGITDALMSHLANVLTDEQKSAFDVYMIEVIALHQDAATMIQQDTFLKSYYEHLLALNGMTVFLERFQEFLRSREFQMDKRGTF